jgi:hypothetical protein
MKDENLAVAACGGGCTVLDPIGPNGTLVNGNHLPHASQWIFNGVLNFQSSPVSKGFFGSLDWPVPGGSPRADVRPASAGTYLPLPCQDRRTPTANQLARGGWSSSPLRDCSQA